MIRTVSLVSVIAVGLQVSALFVGFSANAATPSIATPAKSKKSSLSVGYFGILYGPTVGNFSAYQSDVKGELTDKPIKLENEVSFGYRLSGGGKAYVKAIWANQPEMDGNGKAFNWYDPKVGYSNSRFYRTDNANLYLSVNTYIPMTEYSKSKTMITAPGSLSIFSYKIAGSRWSFRSLNFIRAYFYQNPIGQKDFKVWLWPGINYNISSDVRAEVFYQINKDHHNGTDWDIYRDRNSRLSAGLSWKISRKLELNPQLHFNNLENPSANNMELGMLVFGSFL